MTGERDIQRVKYGSAGVAVPRLYGVFVGVDEYADARIAQLDYARADALAMYRLVQGAIGGPTPTPQLTCLVDGDATKDAVVRAIGENLSRVVEQDDVVLLYFAGHGSPETIGGIDETSRYLVLHDTDYEAIFATGLDLEHELPRLCFDRLRARLVVVFVDACFSGRAGGRTFQGPHLRQARLRRRLRGPIDLTELELGEARVIITACDDDEVAQEYGELGHGVLTYFLMRELTQRAGQEPTVGISGLYDAVSGQVIARTRGRQHPVLNGRTRHGQLPRFPAPPQ